MAGSSAETHTTGLGVRCSDSSVARGSGPALPALMSCASQRTTSVWLATATMRMGAPGCGAGIDAGAKSNTARRWHASMPARGGRRKPSLSTVCIECAAAARYRSSPSRPGATLRSGVRANSGPMLFSCSRRPSMCGFSGRSSRSGVGTATSVSDVGVKRGGGVRSA